MYCTECGNKLNNNDRFCTNCGSNNSNINVNTNVTSDGNNNFSFVFGIVAVVLFFIPFISIPLGIVSIVSSNKNKDGNKAGVILGIVSIVLSVICVLIIGLVFLFIFSFEHTEYIDDGYYEDSYYEEDYYEEENDVDDVIVGNSFMGDDDTILYLTEDMSYVWYTDNVKNSFYSGTYTVSNGYDAVKYISDSLSEYGIDMEEQMDIFNNNRDELEDYYLIIFNCTGYFGDNNNSNNVVDEVIPYYGIYYDDRGYLDLTNMKTNDKVKLTLINENKGNNSL